MSTHTVRGGKLHFQLHLLLSLLQDPNNLYKNNTQAKNVPLW